MDSGAAEAALGAWASVRGFFTPATLFLVVNLVIGTIALTSRSRRRGNAHDVDDANGQHHHQEPPFHQEQQQHQQENQYYDDQHQPQQHEQQYVPAPAPLARTSSVMDRLRSIGHYRFRSGDFPPEYATPVGTDSRDATSAPESNGDAHRSRSRSEPAPAPAEIRRPAPSRMKKSSSVARRADLPRAPAARVVRAAVPEDDDDDVLHDDAHHHQEPPFHQAQQHQQQENQYYDQQQQHHEQQQYVPAEPAPLARTSSVMDRLRSIGLYRFRSGDFPPEYATPVGTDSRDATSAPELASGDAHHARSRSEPAPAPSRMKKSSSVARRAEVPRAPAARVVRAAVLEEDADDVLHYTREDEDDVLHYTRADDDDDVLHYTRADEFTDNSFTTQTPPALQDEEEEEEHYYREEYVPPLRPTPLTRAPSVLERLRSFGLSRFRSGELGHEQTAAAVEELERNHAQKQQATTQYSRSRSEPSPEQSQKGKKRQQETAEARMSKSGSVARNKPPAPVVAADAAEEGGVDARADDFINTFRKELQLQRLNSLLNYKEMLNRGT